MYEKDYIKRQIALLAQALAKILDLAKHQLPEEKEKEWQQTTSGLSDAELKRILLEADAKSLNLYLQTADYTIEELLILKQFIQYQAETAEELENSYFARSSYLLLLELYQYLREKGYYFWGIEAELRRIEKKIE